jgi:hypothetical protein
MMLYLVSTILLGRILLCLWWQSLCCITRLHKLTIDPDCNNSNITSLMNGPYLSGISHFHQCYIDVEVLEMNTVISEYCQLFAQDRNNATEFAIKHRDKIEGDTVNVVDLIHEQEDREIAIKMLQHLYSLKLICYDQLYKCDKQAVLQLYRFPETILSNDECE